ncbi:MAG TPA: DUF1614 domain-containing protein [Methanothrix sp.]|nr:DUF1614 domain-containing protein [Methanothrix sp.]HOI70545.1 DUF1614 domain-containing protein [Methanothrix sp.]
MQTLFEWLLIPISLAILLLVLAAPLIVVYLFFRLSAEAFYQVGFSYWHALLMVFGSFLGSAVDFPLYSGIITEYPPIFIEAASLLSPALDISFPTTFHPTVLAVNLGGCIIPIIVSLTILVRCRVSARRAILGTLVVAAITYKMAMPVAGEGILLPVYVAPTLAAIAGLVLARRLQAAPALAYISGTMGTLLGADIFNLLTPGVLAELAPPMVGPGSMSMATRPLVLSIGGAGVFDGIFLTGIMAVLLAAFVVQYFHRSGQILSTSCTGP